MKIIKIGRDESNDYIVDHCSASRFHSEIRIDDFGTAVYVDHSTNGTHINGIMVHNSQYNLTGTEKICIAREVEINVQDLIRKHGGRDMSTVIMPVNAHTPAPESSRSNGSGSFNANPAMGFGKTLGHFFKHYADFSGRARRSEYWYMVLWNMIFGIVPVVNILWWLTTLIPFLALAVRRLHDVGRSGAWILINLIPVVGPVLMLIWLLTDSEPGANRWGNSPKYSK